MKISIITAVYNNRKTIRNCIESVLAQSHSSIEYIVVDGGSTDGTIEIIKSYGEKISHFISEQDKGMYYAINKGIGVSSGDVIGILHSDDFYATDDILRTVDAHMTTYATDSCYGDLLYVRKDSTDKIVRYWKSCPYREGLFLKGWMPPHPTFFVRRNIYEKYGGYNTSFRIAADYELMLRFLLKYKVSTVYIPEIIVRMRTGGTSNGSLRNMIIKSLEDYRAWTVNSLPRRFYTIPLKNVSKVSQFISRS
ncbi:MAG: glycosyl transferase [Geobacter sp.]|nr:MAG: glycosyl transferase [Geobacter sp.]